MPETPEYILEINNVCKSFPGVKALDDVTFRIRKGETHALLGMNGAGKSTLVKIIAGLYRMDSGSVTLDGIEIKNVKSAAHAQDLGISVVFQELNVLPHMSVLENIFIHREITKAGLYNWPAMKAKAEKIISDLGLPIDINAKIRHLSIAQQQMIEIVRAISFDAKIILLDEPTSSLSPRETEIFFSITGRLHDRGVTLIYISHRLDEIYNHCEKITLLRDGKWVLTEDINALPKDRLIGSMLGRRLEEAFPARRGKPGDIVLRAENFAYKNKFKGVGFSLRRGEILGFAGLVGAGRTEVMKAIYGEYKKDSGDVFLENRIIKIRSAKGALKNGIAYATEDRKAEGLMLERPIRENISLSAMNKIIKLGLIDMKMEREITRSMVDQLKIVLRSVEHKAMNLSGGNQQKVSLAKCLSTDPKVLILDEPTRGIDVGARAEFYRIINELADNGVGIIVISSEEEELIGICDRILVMCNGMISGEITQVKGCEETLMRCMLGLTDAAVNE